MSKEGPVLGKLVPGRMMGRDAVHVAVVPVEAGDDFSPGQRVRVISTVNGYVAVVEDEQSGIEAMGIVDPFLTARVKTGQMFWLCLFPNTITSLRHVWSHPAFQSKPPYLGEEPTK